MSQESKPIEELKTAGIGHWPKVILMGLGVGALCGIFPIVVLQIMQHLLPGIDLGILNMLNR